MSKSKTKAVPLFTLIQSRDVNEFARQCVTLPWDDWTFEQFVEGLIARKAPKGLDDERKGRIITRGGRTLRGAFKGHKGSAFTQDDVDRMIAIVDFEIAFDAGLKAPASPEGDKGKAPANDAKALDAKGKAPAKAPA